MQWWKSCARVMGDWASSTFSLSNLLVLAYVLLIVYGVGIIVGVW